MKISNIALSCLMALAVSSNANAYEDIHVGDFTFTPYARIVVGVDYANNLVDKGIYGDRWQTASNQWGTSYVGLSTRAKLTDGWEAIVNLESGFGTDTGEMNTADTFFDRKANAGVEHQTYGSLTAGTHLALSQDISVMDPMGFQTIGLNSVTNGVNDLVSTNSVLYRSPTFAGFSAAYMHQFGATVGDDARSSGDAGELSFSHSGFDFKTIYQVRADKFGRYSGGQFYGLGSNSQWVNTKNLVIGASYKFGDAKVFAGYDNIKAPEAGYAQTLNTDTKADVYWTGINYNLLDNLTLLGAYYHSKLSDSGKESDLYAAGVNYDWTKMVTFYTTVGYIQNNEISKEAISGAGANNHALNYLDTACDSNGDCNGASQFGAYLGLVVKL